MATKRPLIDNEIKQSALRIGSMIANQYPVDELNANLLYNLISSCYQEDYNTSNVDIRNEVLNLADRVQNIVHLNDEPNAIYYQDKTSILSSIQTITRSDFRKFSTARHNHRDMSTEQFVNRFSILFRPILENTITILIIYKDIFLEYHPTYFDWFEKVFEINLHITNNVHWRSVNVLSFLSEKPLEDIENKVRIELDSIIEQLYLEMYDPNKSHWFEDVCGFTLDSLDFKFDFDTIYQNRNFSPENKMVRTMFKPNRPDKASSRIIEKSCWIDETGIHHYYMKLTKDLQKYTYDVLIKLRETQFVTANKLLFSKDCLEDIFTLTGYMGECSTTGYSKCIPLALKELLDEYMDKYDTLKKGHHISNKEPTLEENIALLNLKSIDSAKFYKQIFYLITIWMLITNNSQECFRKIYQNAINYSDVKAMLGYINAL